MFVSTRSRWFSRLNSWIFIVLVLLIASLLAWLSTRYTWHGDWTRTQRHTLSPASLDIMSQLTDPLTITVYASQQEELRDFISELLTPYQRANKLISVEMVNPLTVPTQVREQGIQTDGELLLQYQGRSEQIRDWSEENVTNAIQRLLRGEYRLITFLTGHGERSPDQFANFDLTDWADHLRSRGFNVETHNISEQGELPKETGLLVLASPRVALLDGELTEIRRYLDDGGNLLWLVDPDSHGEPAVLQQYFGLTLESGLLIDPASQVFGINDPRMITVSDYTKHPLVADFPYITLFIEVLGLSAEPPEGWQQSPLLYSHAQSWLEQTPAQQPPQFDSGVDVSGPIAIGLAFSRDYTAELADGSAQLLEQRVVVMGDGDFLANAYLGNSGNLDLGLRLVNWLVRDDQFLQIPARTVLDKTLTLTPTHSIVLGVLFLLVLPVSLFGIGMLIGLHRRRA